MKSPEVYDYSFCLCHSFSHQKEEKNSLLFLPEDVQGLCWVTITVFVPKPGVSMVPRNEVTTTSNLQTQGEAHFGLFVKMSPVLFPPLTMKAGRAEWMEERKVVNWWKPTIPGPSPRLDLKYKNSYGLAKALASLRLWICKGTNGKN